MTLKFTPKAGLIGFLGLFLTSFVAPPLLAAERIYASYSALERSISVESLEIYAREGRYTDGLQTYGRFLKADQLEKIRGGLIAPVEIEALTIAQFLYTPIGERLLNRVSQVVRPKSGIEGTRALRSALILAAAEEEGLTALNVLKKYPTQGLKVDLGVGLELFAEAQRLIRQTNQVVTAIATAARVEIAEENYALMALELDRPVYLEWEKKSYEFTDETEKRLNYTGRSQTFPVDLYLPRSSNTGPFPIVVISHGLNSHQQSLAYLAQHLVTQGFAVIVPEHPGSSRDQLQSLVSGQANDVINRTEFLDRPLDVSYALDMFEGLSKQSPEFKNKLDFDRVGVMGQSFGGYTALALAGATLDFDNLRSDCDVNLDDTFNFSLLLQCLALRLESLDYELADPRIKGAIALNPLGSSLFGESGMGEISIPTFIFGGSSDTVSPLLPEQVLPQSWLQNANHYFAMVEGGTHFSFINAKDSYLDIPELQEFLGRRPDIAQAYVKSLSLAFMKRHVLGEQKYSAYLTPGYSAYLSREPLPLSLATELPKFEPSIAASSKN
jgi:predicted dienelactone hydrolase